MSYRGFARRASLRSPNYLKLVMDGQRNLSPQMAERFAEACGLEGDAASYFTDLVGFNQASSQRERNTQYARLTSFRRYRHANRLDIRHAAYHSAWYMPAIREMTTSESFEEDPGWVAAHLQPSISKAEARRALETLLELGLLERDEEGRLRQSEPLISTGHEVKGLHVANYHRAMMERAAASIDLIDPADREISSLTLCVSKEGLQRIKARVREFRMELLQLSAEEQNPDRVVQLNFQLFPLSEPLSETPS